MRKSVASKRWQDVLEFQLKNRVIILCLIAVITALSLYTVLTKLEVKTDFFEIYPPKHEYIQMYKEFRKMFGSANVLTMIIERTDGKDIYQSDTLNKINTLTQGALRIKGCNPIQVSSIAHPRVKQVRISYQGVGLHPLMAEGIPETPEECARFKQIVYANEGIKGFYISLDDKSAVVYAGFWEEGVDLDYLFAEVKKLTGSVEDENHKCYVGGYPMLYAWISHYVYQILAILGLTIGALCILVLLYFRRLAGLIIPGMSGAVSAIWGLGFAAAVGITLDPLLLVIPVLLSARALSHSCQCLERFHLEFVQRKDKHKAIISAYAELYPPALLAILTDGLGVLTICVATIPLMQKLAYFSSFWIISIFLAVMVLNPIVISLWYNPSVDDKSLKNKDVNQLSDRKNFFTVLTNVLHFLSGQNMRKPVGALVIIVLVFGGYFTVKMLKVGDSSAGGAILYPDHSYSVAMRKMNQDFAGASRLIVVLQGKEKGAIKDRDSLRVMDDLGLFMKDKIYGVGGTVSLADLVRKIYRVYHEGSPKWDMIPRTKRYLGQIFFQLSASMAPGEMDQFISLPDYTNATVTAFLRDYSHDSIKDAIQQLKDLRDEIDKNPDSKIRLRVAAGILGILAAVNEEVEWSFWAILVVILTTTFCLCLITYRSVKTALILLVPLAIAQILCEIIMLILKIDLNVSSLPVTAIGVGVGIDYGIYLMSRLKEECINCDTFYQARLVTLMTTGKVIMFTAFAEAIGVGFWLLSPMKFSAEMGLLILLLMLFNMICALVLIPTLSGLFRPKFVQEVQLRAEMAGAAA